VPSSTAKPYARVHSGIYAKVPFYRPTEGRRLSRPICGCDRTVYVWILTTCVTMTLYSVHCTCGSPSFALKRRRLSRARQLLCMNFANQNTTSANNFGVRFHSLRNDLYCVEWGVKLYSFTHPLSTFSHISSLFVCAKSPYNMASWG